MIDPPAQALPMIVVTGLPRSGTSMMMRMLEAGGVPVILDGVRRADLDNPNGYYEYEPVKRLKQESSWVAGASGKAVKMVYLLLHDLPPSLTYNVIFMRRVLQEIVASQDEMLRRSGTQVSPDESRRLIGLFRDELRAFEAWLATTQNFRVLYVDYNQTIDKPQETSAQIKGFLGADLDEGRMQSVVTPALYRQRRTVIQPLTAKT
jgi:sulfotransferase family protein